MIERLEGDLLEVGPDHLLIQVGGIGIRVLVSKGVIGSARAGTRVTIPTRLVVRDGEPFLYGFQDAEERAGFDALLSVSGVGPRIALAVLSCLSPDRLALEIEKGSPSVLLTIPGVGKKLAARILLELKGRISLPEGSAGARREMEKGSDLSAEAVRALMALGYPHAESWEAVRAAIRDKKEPPQLDQLVREALVGLSRGR